MSSLEPASPPLGHSFGRSLFNHLFTRSHCQTFRKIKLCRLLLIILHVILTADTNLHWVFPPNWGLFFSKQEWLTHPKKEGVQKVMLSWLLWLGNKWKLTQGKNKVYHHTSSSKLIGPQYLSQYHTIWGYILHIYRGVVSPPIYRYKNSFKCPLKPEAWKQDPTDLKLFEIQINDFKFRHFSQSELATSQTRQDRR
jgi:hypothetical protein